MKGAFLLLFLATANLATGQGDLLHSLWSTGAAPNSSSREADAAITATLNRAQKKNQNDLQYLHRLFDITQKRQFKSYKQYAGIDEVLDGKFDCLTATSWFSLLLTRAGYDFKVIETNYHIFIIVHTSEKDVLLETTDRFNGFVANQNEIAKRIGSYSQNQTASSSPNQLSYQYSFQLYREVAPEKLSGLLYFNQAVKAYNNKDLKLCAEKLEAAKTIYETPRVAALGDLLLQSVGFNKTLTTAEKKNIMNQFSVYKGALGIPLASR